MLRYILVFSQQETEETNFIIRYQIQIFEETGKSTSTQVITCFHLINIKKKNMFNQSNGKNNKR